MRDGRLHSQGDLQEIFTEENLTDFLKPKRQYFGRNNIFLLT